ncbi:hypothetical protein B5M42_022570 [Paenibacillus athensensis]|uniref:Uncharacterized protein n=1 Tax=Paenibacillus athensensis TaxID=1967502 RepID=A0A4Y8PSH7_9BACL|nr:hypothetical protein [Paenibacillus athensensis]MCD1261591.1 hypothetical protein [Paenibacillus athensensis]
MNTPDNNRAKRQAAAQEALLSPMERKNAAPTDPISDAVAEIVQNVEEAFTGHEHGHENEHDHEHGHRQEH